MTDTTTAAVVKWMHRIVNSIVDHLHRAGHPTADPHSWRSWIKESVIIYLHNANVLQGAPAQPQLFYRGAFSDPDPQRDTVCERQGHGAWLTGTGTGRGKAPLATEGKGSRTGRGDVRRDQGGPKIALRGGGGGDGMGARRRRGGGGGAFQKWASVPGPLFCVRTDVATKGAGTQILARKNFFHKKMFPHIYVVKMISATWGSF